MPRKAPLWAVVAGTLALAGFAAPLAGCDKAKEAAAACEGGRIGPSGYCVPRYLSLKSGEVNARKGPDRSYEVLWTYKARGLPVQVVAETREWRKICDPDGATTWVHMSMLDGRRAVRAREPVLLRRRPGEDAAAAAQVRALALAQLDRCDGGWCRISVGGTRGWAPAAALWGVDDHAQCR